jgi:hypothetical protein
VGERTTVKSDPVKSDPVKSNPVKSNPRKSAATMRELTEKSDRIKARLNSRASSIDADSKSLLMAIRNVGTAPLASAGWIIAMALTAVPARSSLPLWLKIAASTAREVLANPNSAKTSARASTSPKATARASSPQSSPQSSSPQ